MTGEMRPTTPPPPPGSSPEPTRPPCAISFLEALDEDSTSLQKRSFDSAMALAQQKENRNCAECLGKIGVSVCPLLLYPAPEAQLIKDVRDNKVVEVQIRRGLKGEATAEAPRPLLNQTLGLLGLPMLPQEDSTPPQPEDTPLPTRSSRKTGELSEVEPRPPCAPELAKFFAQRRSAIDDWGSKNLTLPKGEKKPIKPYHKTNEETYLRAIRLAEEADITADCERCLGPDCPLKNGVPPKTIFDSTSKKSKIEVDISDSNEIQVTEIRTSKYVIAILKGQPRWTIGPSIVSKVDEKLKKRVQDKGGTYPEEAT